LSPNACCSRSRDGHIQEEEKEEEEAAAAAEEETVEEAEEGHEREGEGSRRA
jgi:hypothetical protein